MSRLEQERALTVITEIATALRFQHMTNVQLDLLQVAEHLMVNIAVQVQVAAVLVQPEIDFSIGEPVDVTMPNLSGDEISKDYKQRATIIEKVEQSGIAEYRTTATGEEWLKTDRLDKVKKP